MVLVSHRPVTTLSSLQTKLFRNWTSNSQISWFTCRCGSTKMENLGVNPRNAHAHSCLLPWERLWPSQYGPVGFGSTKMAL